MLRILQAETLPYSWPVDPNAEFEAGMVGQLKLFGNQIVCGVSDGSAPVGVIDDVNTSSFSTAAVDEVVSSVVPYTTSNGIRVSSIDILVTLENPSVIESSFISDPVSVSLVSRNGAIIFPAGTPLNYSSTGSSVSYDSIRTVVNYSYQIPNVPGQNTTEGSGQITIWFGKMIIATDQYETNQRYFLNAPLFVSDSGLLTTRQIDPDYPSIAMVTAPPTSLFSGLELLWF